ncbi:hypothetical protein BLEM_2086 [Bifidobacterium lemurum]|uniref:Nucleotidyl transferase AbiEii/AbiGii toxin family protein n=1 Tax=Bifidobacterium lemurum TaxID=1603886 RepID=A0A261FL74_9BIFI|nr:nucleotidyl transferase AbiEii/AbiGii toxin family protein [Bifidobacterium lemurum]OZG59911.1 hypothetical protein BLEM_2086 [Bifidobacterium lemurum]QOL33937.1 nucleotidyl transferase AbiEii/AbiGii toxin family protein [Bifidobacterium lemurum]
MNANEASLRAQAEWIAGTQGRREMVETIEKELLHYEILDAMDAAGLLDSLVFQGGTSLRLCYGAERYSEDLDFAGGRAFDRSSLDRLEECVRDAVAGRYHVATRVNEPKKDRPDDGLVSTWLVIVDTTPQRKDVRSQRIKIEVASIDAHDPTVRPLSVNYDGLPNSYSDMMIRVESRDEILADKIEAFVCSSHTRYRDLWDLAWLSRQPGVDHANAATLRRMKAVDYDEIDRYAERHPLALRRIEEAFASDAFATEMKRFLPAERLARTIRRPLWLEGAREQLTLLFSQYPPEAGTVPLDPADPLNALDSDAASHTL